MLNTPCHYRRVGPFLNRPSRQGVINTQTASLEKGNTQAQSAKLTETFKYANSISTEG